MNKRQIATLAALLAPAALAGCFGQVKPTPEPSPAAPAAAAEAPPPAANPAPAAAETATPAVTPAPVAAEAAAPAVAPAPAATEASAPVTPAKADGTSTVEELFRDRAAVAGKQVAVRGKVVKVKSGIMGKTWLHIQDGTGAQGTNDLTVTTAGSEPAVGQQVLVKGVAAVNKDFGYGYKYELIVEDASVTAE